MAGIGFELRKILKDDRILSLAKVYGYSAILSSGPWVISIIAIIAVGFINVATMGNFNDTVKFQIVVTYAIALASSLIITGLVQLPFTRYIADLIYAERESEVLPAYFGTIFISWVFGVPFIVMLTLFIFPEGSTMFHIGIISTFLMLCGVWISNVLASSLKYYRSVVAAYLVSYSMIILFSYLIGNSIEYLVLIFFAGNAILFVILMSLIIKSYDTKSILNFGFFTDKNFYWSLALAGFFYNLGAWVDKFIFWYHPLTGYEVVGRLHASIVYDMPIFIAYLSILPGMSIFFFRLESDFAQKYDLYYDAIRQGGTLEIIHRYRNEMVATIRHAVREVMVIQGIVNVILFLGAPKLFEVLHIPQLYLGLFHVLTVGAMLQLGFMSVLAMLYYLDRKRPAMWLSILFFFLNAMLTFASIYMGPHMFGYGYTVSLLIVFSISLIVIRNELQRLDYETFMLQ